jgi:hypothetical protein
MFRKPLFSYGAVALATAVLFLAAPRAAHAIAATLVQVTNTAANPVPNKDVDQQGRNLYQATQVCSTPSPCTISFPSVPTGQRLVVQHVSVFYRMPSSTSLGGAELNSFYGAAFQWLPSVAQPWNGPGPSFGYVSNEQVLAAFDVGDSPVVNVFGTSGAFYATASISGYMISYP